MKILFILNSVMTPSGAEHVLIDFLKSMPEITPFFLHIGPKKPDLSLFLKVTSSDNCFYAPCTGAPMSLFSRQWFMELIRFHVCKRLLKNNVIKKLREDRTISLVYFNNSFEASVFYPLLKDRKKIVHIHDMVDMFRPAQKRCVLEACRNGNQILTASRSCKEMLVRNGIPDSKITVAYNSINVERSSFEEHVDSAVCIGYVGSCIKRKGFDTYISILNKLDDLLKTRGKIVRTIIITNSDTESPYVKESVARLNGDILREIYSGIPRESVFQKYKEMDALLVPSRNDPLPTVVLEAALCGTPVFGSNVDGIPEMVPDVKFLFAVDDSDEAVEKVSKWLSKPFEEKHSDIEKVQMYIEKKFTADNKRRCVLDAIHSVLG